MLTVNLLFNQVSLENLTKFSFTQLPQDLDFMELHPKGIILGPVYRKAIMETIEKDCRVLESFNIMDFSLLLGIHNLDKAASEEKIQVRTVVMF